MRITKDTITSILEMSDIDKLNERMESYTEENKESHFYKWQFVSVFNVFKATIEPNGNVSIHCDSVSSEFKDAIEAIVYANGNQKTEVWLQTIYIFENEGGQVGHTMQIKNGLDLSEIYQ